MAMRIIITSGIAKDLGEDLKYLLAYANHASDQGLCWPGAELVARELGVHPDSVRNAKERLVARGLLKLAVAGGGRGRPAKYLLVLPGLDVENIAQRQTKEPEPFAQKGGVEAAKGGSQAAQTPESRLPLKHWKQEKQQKELPAAEQEQQIHHPARAAMQELGIENPALDRLCKAHPAATAADVTTVRKQIRGQCGPGLIIWKLESGLADAVTRRLAPPPTNTDYERTATRLSAEREDARRIAVHRAYVDRVIAEADPQSLQAAQVKAVARIERELVNPALVACSLKGPWYRSILAEFLSGSLSN